MTRAKASALSGPEGTTSDAVKKPLQTKKSTASTLNAATRRRALIDVTNAAKGADVVQEGKKAAGVKPAAATKPQAATGGVTKLSRTNSSRIATGAKVENAKPKSTESKKSMHGSGSLHKKRTQPSSEYISSKEPTPDVDVEEPPQKKARKSPEALPVEEEFIDIIADLDAEDLDDPSMCAEYVREIFEYYQELEQVTMPNPNYMEHQDDLEWKMRGILVDWLIEVHMRFRLLPETLFLAVNIVDRFLSSKVVPLDKLQLVGITAMFIASKYEEVLSPHVGNFTRVADDGFTVDEVLAAERYTLSTLKYDLSYPNPMNFLRRISKADNYDIQTRTLGKYFMELSLVDHRFLKYRQSHIAAAAMYLGRAILERGPWVSHLMLSG